MKHSIVLNFFMGLICLTSPEVSFNIDLDLGAEEVLISLLRGIEHVIIDST